MMKRRLEVGFSGGSVLRVSMDQSAADALEADIGLLRDRIGGLLPADAAHTITISVTPVETPPAASTLPSTSHDGGAAQGGRSSFGAGNGERSTPHEEDRPSPQREWISNDQDVGMRPAVASGLVV